MSRWTHAICGDCWRLLQGNRRPTRLRNPDEEVCCFCGAPTVAGIYYRADPSTLDCKGERGGVHQD